MKVKNNFLLKNQIWKLTQLSSKAHLLTNRWVFRLKKNKIDDLLKFKARWTIHKYKQKNELNYLHTFVIVIKSMLYKFFMTISIKQNLKIKYMNVVVVFLYEFLNEIIYVIQFILFEIEKKKQIICLLKKAFYDLKQTSQV